MNSRYRVPRLTAAPDVPKLIDARYRYLLHECDVVGGEMFAGQWNGKELVARPLPDIGSELARPWPYTMYALMRRHSTGPLNVITKLSRSGAPSPDEGWWALDFPSAEISFFPSRGEAEAAWQDALAPTRTIASTEQDARRRFESARYEVRARLASGDCTAFIFDRKSGREHQIPVEYWRSDRSVQVFELGDDPGHWSDPNYTCLAIGNFDVCGNIVMRDNQFRSREHEFLSQQTTNPKAKPCLADSHSQIRGYSAADAPLIDEMKPIVAGEKISAWAVAKRVVGKAAGKGSDDAKLRRLVKRYYEQTESETP